MNDADVIRFIRKEVTKQVFIILSGATKDAAPTTESIESLYPGAPTLTGRPIMRPYGFISIAPDGTIQVTARQGENPGNRVVLGHRAADQPDDLESGESAVFSSGGYECRILNGKIEVGKDGDFETVVVGETLRQFLITLVNAIVAHTHLGNLGYPTGTPINAAQFTAAKADNLDNKKILAEDGGRY